MARAQGDGAAADAQLLELVAPDGRRRILTRAELEALPQVAFVTSTQWTKGRPEFRGPLLRDVLALAGLDGRAVATVAENDYAVTILPEAVGTEGPIVATRIDGRAFSRRQLGPLWVVFPYDSGKQFQTEAVYAMSIWQLVRIQPAGQ